MELRGFLIVWERARQKKGKGLEKFPIKRPKIGPPERPPEDWVAVQELGSPAAQP